MSIIPKIKVSLPKKREKINLSFDCSTTGNIGTVQPSMCREMVPGETFKVKVSSVARLLALNVPTFGRMSLRNYHVFVPYKDIWEPFECMLAGQPYVQDNVSYTPSATPYFDMNSVVQKIIMNYSEVSCYPKDDLTNPIIFDPEDMTTLTACQAAWTALRGGSGLFGDTTTYKFNLDGAGSLAQDGRGFLNFGNYCFFGDYNTATLKFDPLNNDVNMIPVQGGRSVVTYEGADLITNLGSYTFCFKFRPVAKRIRQIFIGLGYQFSPYSVGVRFNAFKLLAYYKAWFELFRPTREKSFNMTNCYKIIHGSRSSSYNGANLATMPNDLWIKFLGDLAKDCYYYLPMDYFGMSTLTPNQPNSDVDYVLRSNQNVIGNQYYDMGVRQHVLTNVEQNNGYTEVGAETLANAYPIGSVNSIPQQYFGNPLLTKMALRLLTFANKNTVIGRSVREWLKVHYGVVDPSELDSNGVIRLGSSRINVQIGDVMATAETQIGDNKVMPLGGFAGKGIAYGDSETFDYTAKQFGVWLTLTVIVPESGYYQGYMLENRHQNRYQFFTPEFDALGYQVLERGELIDDYNCDGTGWNPKTGFDRTAGFGLVPRYSEYKVGRNIVNGDLSLIGMYNSMAPYTLDRRIPAGATHAAGYLADSDGNGNYTNVRNKIAVTAPGFVPTVVYDDFRRIDPTDHLGQYNRIFNYGLNDIDHFIIHMVFDVKAIAPMKSLSTSFDTIQQGEETIDVTKA